jgi:hypothetical protein
MIAMEREFWRRVCAHEAFGDTRRVPNRVVSALKASSAAEMAL